MTITAKYAGVCWVCGNGIRPGDKIEWNKTTRQTRHAGCAEPDLSSASYSYRFVGASRADAPRAGYVFRAEHGPARGKHLVVVTVQASYVSPEWAEDNDDFDFENGGWAFVCRCREATADEAAPLIAEEEARIAKARAREDARRAYDEGLAAARQQREELKARGWTEAPVPAGLEFSDVLNQMEHPDNSIYSQRSFAVKRDPNTGIMLFEEDAGYDNEFADVYVALIPPERREAHS